MTAEEQKYLALCILTTCLCLCLFTAFIIRKTAPSVVASSLAKETGSEEPNEISPITGEGEGAGAKASPAVDTRRTSRKDKEREQGAAAAKLGRMYAEKGDLELALDHLTVSFASYC